MKTNTLVMMATMTLALSACGTAADLSNLRGGRAADDRNSLTDDHGTRSRGTDDAVAGHRHRGGEQEVEHGVEVGSGQDRHRGGRDSDRSRDRILNPGAQSLTEGVAVSIEGSVPAEAPAKTKRGKPALTEPADKE